jgi:hypothetical protein
MQKLKKHLINKLKSTYNLKKVIIMKKLIVAVSFLLFSLSVSSNMKCVENPNDLAPGVNSKEQGQMTMQMYEDKQNPVMDLMACANMTDFKSVKKVFSECGCWEAVKELCKFDPKDFGIKAAAGASVAMCTPFAPWN